MSKNNEVALSFRQQILHRHEQSKLSDGMLRELLIGNIESKRETGQLIADARGTLKDQEFAQATDFLSSDSVKSYLKFARLNPEPITDLAIALRAIEAALTITGTLPASDGHGPQNLHEPNFFSAWTQLMQTAAAKYRQFIRRYPMEDWRAEARDGFLSSLQPIRDIDREVTGTELK